MPFTPIAPIFIYYYLWLRILDFYDKTQRNIKKYKRKNFPIERRYGRLKMEEIKQFAIIFSKKSLKELKYCQSVVWVLSCTFILL